MLDAPGERACRALVAVFEMAAVLPCERRRLARACEESRLCLDTVADARHRGIFCARLAVAEAEVDGLRIHCVLPRVIEPAGKPDGRRSGGAGGERVRLAARVEREERRERIAADEEAGVALRGEFFAHERQEFVLHVGERLRGVAAEAFLAEDGRGRPRREVVVPAIDAEGGEQDARVWTGGADESVFALQ